MGLAARRPPFTRPNLKKLVYGTERPSLELETERAIAEARRIIGNMQAIETAFPAGFGVMAQEIRSWKKPADPTATPKTANAPPNLRPGNQPVRLLWNRYAVVLLDGADAQPERVAGGPCLQEQET